MPQPDLWTDDFMNAMRQTGDPLADNVTAELFADGTVNQVNALMRTLVMNEYVAVEDVPPVVGAYLQATAQLPASADPAKIEAAQQLFWRYGPELLVVLLCYGLPFCYLGRNGVPTLALTTRLLSNPSRRVLETAQLLIDVMHTGGLTTDTGRGRRTIQKVRLMHSAVRRLAPKSPDWKTEYGLPVNQEDLAGTLMAFSWVALDGLKKLGLDITADDQQAYMHVWCLIGEMLGMKSELLPATVEEGGQLAHTIARREFAPTGYGVELTKALTDMLADAIPGNIFRHAPRFLIKYFLGDPWAEWLGVKEPNLLELVAAPLHLLGFERSTVLNDSAAVRALTQHVGKLIIGSLAYVERAGNRPSFTIPTELKEQWGVNWIS